MKPRLLIIASHPVQYQAPWFRALHADARIELKVMYLSVPDAREQGAGFDRVFSWDVPLLEGYDWMQAPSAVGGIHGGWWGLRLKHAERGIGAQRPDAVLVTGWHKLGMLQCIRATRRLRVPLLIRGESHGRAPLSPLRSARHRWIVQHATRVLPIGCVNREFYQRLGMAGRVGMLVPYSVDNEFFEQRVTALNPRRAELRAGWGIPKDTCCFLFAGKFVTKKQPRLMLDALARIAPGARRPVHLLMVGSGPLESDLQGIATQKSLPAAFAGFLNQTEMPRAYAAADCLVLPSDYGETWGLVVNEAMACGLPAIVSDRVGCGPDLVMEGKTGFVFSFGDAESLAERMLRMATMPETERQAMGRLAREHVQSYYSIDVAVNKLIGAVGQIVNERGGHCRA
jgi:glycosyltransferase involved in cell wall biosynthesis